MRVLDKDVLRAELPLMYVCDGLGIHPDDSGQAICIFHDDHRPSLYFYLDDRGVEKWACPPCGIGGDVFDLIMQAKQIGFSQALIYARDVLENLPEGVSKPKPKPKSKFDINRAEALIQDSWNRAKDNVGFVCVALGLAVADEPRAYREDLDSWLTSTMRVGVGQDGESVLPHYDAIGRLAGVKFRALDGVKWSFPGSQWTSLYGSWLPRRHQDVLICEGETDALWAMKWNQPIDVYALPGGAGKFYDVWATIDASRVFLALDADEAGDAATATWLASLTGRDVRLVQLPRSEDLRSCGVPVEALLKGAQRYSGST